MKFLFLMILFFSTMLYASIGRITSLEGHASILRNNEVISIVMGNDIEKKDIISTEINSKVKITLNDNTIISIGKESTLNIEEYVFDTENTDSSTTELNFVKGAFHTITGQIGKINPSKFKLKTKSATIGIRGTEIYGDQSHVACTKGTIDVTSFGKINIVPSGNFIDTFVDKLPSEVKFLDDKILNKIKTKLNVNKEGKSLTFSTKNSISKKGTTTVSSKNGTITVQEDGSLTYESKDGFKGEDTIVLVNINGDETTTEVITLIVTDDNSIPTELNLESITTTNLSDLNDTSLLKNNGSNTDSISYDNQKTQDEVNDSKKDNINSIVLNNTSITVQEGDSLKTGKLEALTTSKTNLSLTYTTASSISGFILNSNGTYSFNATNSSYDSLNKNQNKILTIPITVKDETGLETTSNLEITVIGNTDLSGKHLGALVNSTTPSTSTQNNFTLNTQSKMNVYDNKIVLGEYDVVKSAQLSYNNFSSSGYTFHSNIGTASFSQNVNQTQYQGTYSIHSDNVGEFIVGSSEENWNIASASHNYKNLFYDGLVSSKSVLDNSKIYTYKMYKGIKVENDASGVLTSAFFDNSTDKLVKINTKTGSIISINLSDKIIDSALRFNVAKINSDGTISAKSYVTTVDNQGISVESQSTINGQIYGGKGQGIGINGDVTNYTSSSTPSNKEVAKTFKMLETYYLDNNETVNNLSSGTASLSGFSSIIYSGENSSNSNIKNKISFDINSDTGSFSNGVISKIDNRDIYTDTFSISGNVNSLTSYYLNNDNFGVKIDSYLPSDSNSLVSNSSWIIAIPDKLNSSGTFVENLDNESSWGYWTAKTNDTSNNITNINAYSTWVAGTKTDVNYVQNLINSSTNTILDFKGSVIGAIQNGSSIDAISLDSSNLINLKFTLGSQNGTFNGNFAFNTKNEIPWSGNFSGVANSSGFSGTNFSNLSVSNNNVVSADIITPNSIDGNYYGTGEIKSVGGSIKVNTANNGKLIGSFKADKN